MQPTPAAPQPNAAHVDADAIANGHAEPVVKPEGELDAATLRRRAKLGVLFLVGRTVLMQVAVFGGTIYLSRLLDPGDFGVFQIVQFALAFFALFGDAGLAAALVQKQGTPTKRELSSIWWLQILLSFVVVGVVELSAPFIVRVWPSMPGNATLLLRLLAVTLVLTSARVVPAILLERELKFGHLAGVEVVLTVVYYGVAVGLALAGLGVMSLLWAVVAQGVVGLVLLFALRPWLPSFIMDRKILKPILRFGLAYQARSIIGFANGATTPLYGGAMLGQVVVGLNNWAMNTAYFPIQLVGIIGRVTFPLYSRMASDRAALARALEASIRICATVTLFFTAFFLGLGTAITHVVYGDKWLPAIGALYVHAVAISIGFLVPLVGAALDAVGKPQILFRLSVFWTTLNWIVVVLAMTKWRTLEAFAIAYSVHVVVGNLATLLALRWVVPGVRVLRSFVAPAVALAVVVPFERMVLASHVGGVVGLVLSLVAALVVFVGVVALVDRSAVRDTIALFAKEKK